MRYAYVTPHVTKNAVQFLDYPSESQSVWPSGGYKPVDSLGWTTLVLQTQAGCDFTAKMDSESSFEIDAVDTKKSPAAGKQLTLGGTLVPQALSQSFDKKKVSMKPQLAGSGTYELRVDTVLNEYPVKISGSVDAVECPK